MQNTIDNCKVEIVGIPANSCEECNDGYDRVRSDNPIISDSCCKSMKFAEQNNGASQCKNKWKIESDCLTWDRKKLLCTKCKEPKYLSGGKCCAESFYSTVSETECIPLENIDNCLRYDDVNGCTKCDPSFILNRSKSKIQAEACLELNP